MKINSYLHQILLHQYLLHPFYPHDFKVIKIDIVLADNFPLLYVTIPRSDEKRRSDGELKAQTERNPFANIPSRGYFSDPILHHYCRASR